MTNFGKVNLNPSYCAFNSIEYINLNLLSLNKDHIKSADIVAQKSNLSLTKILQINMLIMNFRFVLVLVI